MDIPKDFLKQINYDYLVYLKIWHLYVTYIELERILVSDHF